MGRKRSSTRFSDDGYTVSVRLRVNRCAYEFARQEAMKGSGEPPESYLEEHLHMAMCRAMPPWEDLPDIKAPAPASKPTPDMDDDDIPF